MNVDAAIVGAGQAGLSVSQQLTERSIDHVVLERHDIGESWRRRWDRFCLVTPNWSVMLPGYPYDGDDPDGFMPRDEIVAFLKRHAASFSAPVKTAVTVDKVEKGDRFELTTSDGPVTARSLVLATGAFQKPRRPRGAELVPKDIYQIDLDGYRNPDGLPAGAVLVVGSGQSGCQIAEELHQAGRRVTLACGRANRLSCGRKATPGYRRRYLHVTAISRPYRRVRIGVRTDQTYPNLLQWPSLRL